MNKWKIQIYKNENAANVVECMEVRGRNSSSSGGEKWMSMRDAYIYVQRRDKWRNGGMVPNVRLLNYHLFPTSMSMERREPIVTNCAKLHTSMWMYNWIRYGNGGDGAWGPRALLGAQRRLLVKPGKKTTA